MNPVLPHRKGEGMSEYIECNVSDEIRRQLVDLTAENKRLREEVVRLRDANEAWHVRVRQQNQENALLESEIDNEREKS